MKTFIEWLNLYEGIQWHKGGHPVGTIQPSRKGSVQPYLQDKVSTMSTHSKEVSRGKGVRDYINKSDNRSIGEKRAAERKDLLGKVPTQMKKKFDQVVNHSSDKNFARKMLDKAFSRAKNEKNITALKAINQIIEIQFSGLSRNK